MSSIETWLENGAKIHRSRKERLGTHPGMTFFASQTSSQNQDRVWTVPTATAADGIVVWRSVIVYGWSGAGGNAVFGARRSGEGWGGLLGEQRRNKCLDPWPTWLAVAVPTLRIHKNKCDLTDPFESAQLKQSIQWTELCLQPWRTLLDVTSFPSSGQQGRVGGRRMHNPHPQIHKGQVQKGIQDSGSRRYPTTSWHSTCLLPWSCTTTTFKVLFYTPDQMCDQMFIRRPHGFSFKSKATICSVTTNSKQFLRKYHFKCHFKADEFGLLLC